MEKVIFAGNVRLIVLLTEARDTEFKAARGTLTHFYGSRWQQEVDSLILDGRYSVNLHSMFMFASFMNTWLVHLNQDYYWKSVNEFRTVQYCTLQLWRWNGISVVLPFVEMILQLWSVLFWNRMKPLLDIFVETSWSPWVGVTHGNSGWLTSVRKCYYR